MTKTEILEKLENAQNALSEIVNNSNVGIKKIATLIKLKRDINKIIEMDFAIIDVKQTTINYEQ